MSGKNKGQDMLAKLTAMNEAAVSDVPPVVKAAAAARPIPSPTAPPPATARKGARTPLVGGTAGRQSAVNLHGPAVDAMRRIQAFLLADAGATAASASAAICIALEFTAALLPEHKRELSDLYAATRQKDKRRRQEA